MLCKIRTLFISNCGTKPLTWVTRRALRSDFNCSLSFNCLFRFICFSIQTPPASIMNLLIKHVPVLQSPILLQNRLTGIQHFPISIRITPRTSIHRWDLFPHALQKLLIWKKFHSCLFKHQFREKIRTGKYIFLCIDLIIRPDKKWDNIAALRFRKCPLRQRLSC